MALDFNKIKDPPETNKLLSENQNVAFMRIEPKVLVEVQYFAAARAIEMIDRLRSGARDIDNPVTISNIKDRLIYHDPLTEEERDGEYDAYLAEMEDLELSPILKKDEFLFYRDQENINHIIPDVLEMMGLERLASGE